MAHSKSAEKRIRQNATRRLANRSAKSSLRTATKKFDAAVKAGNAEAVKTACRDVQRKADRTAAKGVIDKRKAARIKSRLDAKAKALVVKQAT